ncbi:MAG: DEAD/DEAH box helicase, partial [Oligoflexales bacterium]|nr:DEAD/DEAH box helicase [Oligoflexales bacterium]
MDNFDIEKTIRFLKSHFSSEIRAHKTILRREGDFHPLPGSLNPDLKALLVKMGISSLYSHQIEAYETISQMNDTVIVSQTASGKTLSFLIPIMNQYLNEKKPFSVLFLYPTKALSRDQESTISKMMRALVSECKMGTFDGDTPIEEREFLQKNADFIITNPDMLHSGILPNHNRRWRNFLARLRFIVVDEVHSYKGAFGSHTSNVFRRLMRVCEIHGKSPQFIACSATSSNPGEHAEALFHKPFRIVSKDGAPKPSREFYFLNPGIIKGPGDTYFRKGVSSISIPLIRNATENGIRTICFCRARQQVERLYRAVTDGKHQFRDKIKPYRGGLLPNERRSLERDLFNGRINTIITTNALELGIDIGSLQLCILSGHPGSIASFWQQAGRVGRRFLYSVSLLLKECNVWSV